jgi:hypothetical protein
MKAKDLSPDVLQAAPSRKVLHTVGITALGNTSLIETTWLLQRPLLR